MRTVALTLLGLLALLGASATNATAVQLRNQSLPGVSNIYDRNAFDTETALDRPQSIEPLNYYILATRLWERGDRAQAAFWFYIAQSRSRAWVRADPSLAPGRAAVNAQVGAVINPWVGSDYDAWMALVERAFAYEKKLPLYNGRPDGISGTEWRRLVESERAAYEADFRNVKPRLFATKEQAESGRRAGGLPVGPWDSPGAPLRDEWK